MIRPERRTRGDLAVAGAIVVIAALVVATIWWTSDARATHSRPAAQPAPAVTTAVAVPDRLTPRWSAASPHTSAPVVVGGAVVTGAGREAAGRDPAGGAVLWSYARDRDLCGVTWVSSDAIAVYRDRRGCGQVTALHADTGRRATARTAYADPVVALSTDGVSVLSAGDSRVELWRSDLVRSLSYGAFDAPLNPPADPQPPCRFLGSAASSATVAVLEACPDSPDVRLALLRPGDEEDRPLRTLVNQPGLSADSGVAVVAVADTRTALYQPTPTPRVVVLDDTGTTIASTLLPAPADPAGPVTRAGDLLTWFTGDSVMVFDARLNYRFTVASSPAAVPRGPATQLAGRLLVPVTGGLAVFDSTTGAAQRVIPVDRPTDDAPVVPAVAGDMVLEQRGEQLVALGPA